RTCRISVNLPFMGSSSDPDFDLSVFHPLPEEPPVVVPSTPAPSRRRESLTRYVVLFAFTLATTTFAGARHYANFVINFSGRILSMGRFVLLLPVLLYGLPFLLLLVSHVFVLSSPCRYYRVDSSRPYFLPAPPGLVFTGTVGAVIRIRQTIPGKRALFDI